MKNKAIKKLGTISLATLMAFSAFGATTINIAANEEVSTFNTDASGYSILGSIASVSTENNKVTFTISTGERLRFTFLENNVFRLYMAPSGADFQEYPTANNSSHTATITSKKDAEYDSEYAVRPEVVEGETTVTISTEKLKIEITKEGSLVKVMKANGDVVWEETAPLKYKTGSTVQTLKTDENENFFGGGTQNGRFTHKGEIIEIKNTNSWINGGVASPNPFYWSTGGYGVVRNTWKPGTYDFGKTESGKVITTHDEKRYDAYFFIDDAPVDILKDYYELTGTPVELPEYASYLGHLNCYNRDFWVEVSKGTGGAVQLGDKWYKESQSDNGGKKETLLGEENATAQQIIEDHKNNDMPLGWFLPNDGYGCGYGQGTTQAEDIDNLRDFSDYAIENGVETGLWTQSNLWPADPSNPKKGERDIYKEVEAGVHSVKTDVAWVGAGYSMALNGISVAYDAIATKSGQKPNIVSLDGWAGTQRYAGIWSGDQYGGQWEYIRFHIPTYIGTGLSGQPNIGSDMDGIFGGKNEKVWTRDFQWKAFTTYMLDMDGWGSNQKTPWALGENGTSINRSYLKLKAKLMPYVNTISHEATAKEGLPMIRAMFLEESNAYTLGTETQYQYMWGDNFLVAPIYKETNADAEGNDIRNDIYLPSTSDVWTDYFTGKQYRGGQVLNDFDAPIWKLPLFVKNGAIIPMYPENNNPEEITDTNVDGLDRSQRIVEFYPSGNTEFNLFEDDGKSLGGATTNTLLTSKVDGTTATLKADKTVGSYTGMIKERSNEFIVNVSKAPTKVSGEVKGKNVEFTLVSSQEEYDNASGNVYFYDEAPSMFVKEFASEGSKYADATETTTPKLYIKSNEKVDVNANSFTVVVEGFENSQDLGKDELNEAVETPLNAKEVAKTNSEITFGWDVVAGASTYDVEADGIIYRNISRNEFVQYDLKYSTNHTYRVRTVKPEGYSNWTELLTIQTDDDPYRNVPKDMTVKFDGGNPPSAYAGKFENMFDGINTTEYSSGAANAWKGQALTMDFGKAYTMDKLEYICRENMGNGAATKFGVQYSNDGINWKEYGDLDNVKANSTIVKDNEDGRLFTHKFSEPFKARYLKLTVKASAGGFLQAYEIRPFAMDGDRGTVVGDVNNSGGIEENDLMFLENYIGLIPSDGDWEYAAALGNIDDNDLIDAFDLSYVARLVGDPIVEPVKGVDGKIEIIPSKTDIKAGDEITLNIYGIGLENVNAFSVELPVDGSLFEVSNFGSTSLSTMFMRNFSKTRFHNNGSVDNYVTFTNVGKQDLISGTGSIASMKITAKADFTWDTKATRATLVGQDLSVANAIIDETVRPVLPKTESILKASDVSGIVFNNDVKQNMTGSELWQQTNWKELLFDGDKAGMAEFKWYMGPDSITEEVKIPTDMEFTFTDSKSLTKVKVYNRIGSNGSVTSIKAKAYKGDTEYDLGIFNAQQDIFEFSVPKEATEGIDRVVITPLTSVGKATGVTVGSEDNRMLSLREIEFVTDSAVAATGIKFKDGSATSTSMNGIADVSAIVAPNNASNPFYDITSSDPSIARVIKVPTEKAYYYAVHGISTGEVTLTATSENGAHQATMNFTVVAGADSSQLEKEFETFEALYSNLYTEKTYSSTKAVYDEAKVLLEKEEVTQEEVNAITLKLIKSLKTLEFKGSDTDQASSGNLISQENLKAHDQSSMSASEKQGAEFTIDGKMDTIWHSNYNASYSLPQWVTIDLGKEYLLEQIDMLTRQNGANGQISHYRVEISNDLGDEKKFIPIVEGYFANDGSALETPDIAKEVKFKATTARFVRFIAIESFGGTPNKYAAIAELNFYGKQALPTMDEALELGYQAAVKEESYTLSSFNTFMDAYDNLYDLSMSEEATDSEISAAIASMMSAMDALKAKADKVVITAIESNIAEGKKLESNYTEKEFANMKAAIEAAEVIIAKGYDEITKEEATLAQIALLDAKLELIALGNSDTLLENLKAVISFANAELESDEMTNVRPGKVKALIDAVAAGQALVDEGATDKTAIRAASFEITKATQELWLIVNKDGLNTLISHAEAIVGDFTVASKEELTNAITEAKEVSANDDATLEEVATSYTRVNNAINNLVAIANKDALANQIAIAEKIVANSNDYVAITIRGLSEMLNQAKELNANDAATQVQVDNMSRQLTAANLRARVKADKTALVNAVRQARSINLNGFTLGSAQNVLNAITNAEQVLANDAASKTEIDLSIKAIDTAINSLVTAPDGVVTPPTAPEVAAPEAATPEVAAPVITPNPSVVRAIRRPVARATQGNSETPKTEAVSKATTEKVDESTTPKVKTAMKNNTVGVDYGYAGLGLLVVALAGIIAFRKKASKK